MHQRLLGASKIAQAHFDQTLNQPHARSVGAVLQNHIQLFLRCRVVFRVYQQAGVSRAQTSVGLARAHDGVKTRARLCALRRAGGVAVGAFGGIATWVQGVEQDPSDRFVLAGLVLHAQQRIERAAFIAALQTQVGQADPSGRGVSAVLRVRQQRLL